MADSYALIAATGTALLMQFVRCQIINFCRCMFMQFRLTVKRLTFARRKKKIRKTICSIHLRAKLAQPFFHQIKTLFGKIKENSLLVLDRQTSQNINIRKLFGSNTRKVCHGQEAKFLMERKQSLGFIHTTTCFGAKCFVCDNYSHSALC